MGKGSLDYFVNIVTDVTGLILHKWILLTR